MLDFVGNSKKIFKNVIERSVPITYIVVLSLCLSLACMYITDSYAFLVRLFNIIFSEKVNNYQQQVLDQTN